MRARVSAIVKPLLIAGVVAVLLAEIAARLAFGFSMDEPIVILDPHCEYRLAPGEYTGGYRVNALGMRSEPFPIEKPADEFRVLVLGDSITEGDTSIPNESLATYGAERVLNAAPANPDAPPRAAFRVLNASVGSWSVMNQVGYIDAFGDFDADAIAIVFNTADAADGFGSPLAPTSQPICGLHRGLRLLRIKLTSTTRQTAVFNEPGGIFARANADALHRLIDHADSRGIPLIAVWHPTRAESESGYDEPRARSLLDVFDARGIEVVRFAEALRADRDDSETATADPYADHIHLSESGHQILAETIAELIMKAMEHGTAPTPSGG